MSAQSQAIVLPAYNSNLIRSLLSLKVEDRILPDLRNHEVLVKTHFAPINPSDIAFLQGGYNVVKTLPCVPGFEASGKVIETGINSHHLLGKKVNCFVQSDNDGTWADYFIADANNCVVLREGMDMEQAACLGINPFTAYGLLEAIKKNKCNAIVQNAAGGQVGEMIRILCRQENIKVINLVRKKETASALKHKGYEQVLDITAENFLEDFSRICNENHPTLALDAIGGSMGGIMLNNLHDGGLLISYGGLSGEDISQIDTLELIFRQKNIEGFNLNEWIAGKTNDQLQEISFEIQELFIKGIFHTPIASIYSIDDVVNAIKNYIKNMSAGKVLLRFE